MAPRRSPARPARPVAADLLASTTPSSASSTAADLARFRVATLLTYRQYCNTVGIEMAVRLTRVERKARTRDEILEAAHRVFLRDGFHRATLERHRRGGRLHDGRRVLELRRQGRALPRAARRAVRCAARATRRELQRRTESRRGPARERRLLAETARREPLWAPLLVEFWTHASRDPRLRAEALWRHDRVLDVDGRSPCQHRRALRRRRSRPARELVRVRVRLRPGHGGRAAPRSRRGVRRGLRGGVRSCSSTRTCGLLNPKEHAHERRHRFCHAARRRSPRAPILVARAAARAQAYGAPGARPRCRRAIAVLPRRARASRRRRRGARGAADAAEGNAARRVGSHRDRSTPPARRGRGAGRRPSGQRALPRRVPAPHHRWIDRHARHLRERPARLPADHGGHAALGRRRRHRPGDSRRLDRLSQPAAPVQPGVRHDPQRPQRLTSPRRDPADRRDRERARGLPPGGDRHLPVHPAPAGRGAARRCGSPSPRRSPRRAPRC